jgi:FkbM family methyltransferase
VSGGSSTSLALLALVRQGPHRDFETTLEGELGWPVVSNEPFISYAQNGEDVVLWRALGHVDGGIYVDVGGWDPDEDSVTRAFYDRGWRGIDIEPVPDLAERFRRRRPNNEVVQAVITDESVDHVVLHRFGSSGLSTMDDELAGRHADAGIEHEDITVPARRLDDVLAESHLVDDTIHFLKIDVEGAEGQVIDSIDLASWRPWVLVIEATEPNSTATTHEKWEPTVLAAGYTFTLFDGLSRFYVSSEHPEIADKLSYPANPLDGFASAREAEFRATVETQQAELQVARQQALRWRGEAVGYWAEAVARVQKSEDAEEKARADADRLGRQLARVREQLRQVREDRRRLRAKLTSMKARIEQMEKRDPDSAGLTRGRVRAAVKKVIGE